MPSFVLISSGIPACYTTTQVGVGVTGLQLPCDIRFVWAGAKLAFPFVRRGIAPEGASCG